MEHKFSIHDLGIEGVKLISPFYTEDKRGYFLKSLQKDIFSAWGLNVQIYEDFETYSKKNVIRGLHFQTKEPQIKLVRVIKGTVHDIIVDLRKGSSSFGKYVEVVLSEENHNSLWIPKGCAHGFEVLSEDALMSYKCVGKYLEGYDTGIRWNDRELAIKWKIENPIISEKDMRLMSFHDFLEKYGGL